MRNILVIAFFAHSCHSSHANASDWGFRFQADSKVCKNSEGKIGYNPGFLGECGNLKKADLRYLTVFFPSPIKLVGALVDEADLMAGDLREGDLRNGSFVNANLNQAVLSKADLRDAKLTGVRWDRTILDKANMSSLSLQGADLRTAILRETNLSAADLQEANLSGNHSLSSVNLTDASLEKSNFSNTYMYSANLKGAFLDEADFSYAILFDADLTDAQIEGTQFTGAKYNEGTLLPFEEKEARDRGMVFISDPNAKVNPINIEGKEDESCEPSEIHLTLGKKVTFTLKATSKMFMFKVPDLKIELMAMGGQISKLPFTPSQKGEFEFTCGIHNGTKVTKGKIIVM